jgi:apolipoprotein N-acyltransferase
MIKDHMQSQLKLENKLIAKAFGFFDANPLKAAALTGLILAFCHPFVWPGSGGPPHFPVLGAMVAWVALIPLLRAVTVERKRRTLIAMAYLSFGLQLAISVYWLDVPINRFGGLPHIVSFIAIIAIACITGTYLALGFVGARFVSLRLGWSMRWTLPFFWLSTDYIRGAWIYGYPFSGFPWAHLSATQVEHPLTRQLAAIAGIEGIGLWLFALNAALLGLLETMPKRDHLLDMKALRRPAVAVLALLVPALVWGAAWQHRVAKEMASARQITMGIVQGNLSQDIKNQLNNRKAYMLKVQSTLTTELAKQKPDIIMWSEVTYPGLLERDNPDVRAKALGYNEQAPAPPVTLLGASVYWLQPEGACSNNEDCRRGATCRDGRCVGYSMHNSMLALDPKMKMLGRADKHNLVPFGEYVPGESLLGLLGIRQLVPIAGRMKPAENIAPVETPVAKIGGLICYEGVFPEIPLKLRLAGAELLVNPTNDTWYGRTSGPWQHLAFYRFRAIETGLSVARAANSGISGWFDPAGKSYDLSELDKVSAKISKIPLPVIDTPWVVTRGLPGLLILLVAPGLLIFAGLKRRKNVSAAAQGEAV